MYEILSASFRYGSLKIEHMEVKTPELLVKALNLTSEQLCAVWARVLEVGAGQQRVHVLVVELARVGGVARHPGGQLGAVALHARPPHALRAAAAAHAQLHEVRALRRHHYARHQVAAGPPAPYSNVHYLTR